MKHSLILLLFIGFASAACSADSTLRSSSLPSEKRVSALRSFLEFHSDVLYAEYILYDVNMNSRSIPGATNKDYMIYLEVAPSDSSKWISSSEITSFPHDMGWTKQFLSSERNANLKKRRYITTYKKDSSYEKTVWVNSRGIVLIRYVQH